MVSQGRAFLKERILSVGVVLCSVRYRAASLAFLPAGCQEHSPPKPPDIADCPEEEGNRPQRKTAVISELQTRLCYLWLIPHRSAPFLIF